MKKHEKQYQITIALLIAVILLQWLIIFSRKPQKAVVVVARKPAAVTIKGKIAIVLDDWGYNLNNLPVLSQIKSPLTASILPNLPYSSRVAKELNRRGFQVMLHLPMEPHEKYKLEKNTILVNTDELNIKNIISTDLDSVLYAKGVNNHMGSLATENSKVMEVVCKELKKRHLFFLDSYVTPKSVAEVVCNKAGVAFAKRDIFLDNKSDPAYIRAQIEKLKDKARVNGYAVGIGHDRPNTLLVLKETMPQLEKEGYKLVFLADLLE